MMTREVTSMNGGGSSRNGHRAITTTLTADDVRCYQARYSDLNGADP